MTFKLTLNEAKYKVEVDGFGVFTVRPLGAGEELEMARLQREISKNASRAQHIKDEIVKEGLTKEEVDALVSEADELSQKIFDNQVHLSNLFRSQISSEKKGAVEKLFKTVQASEIVKLINKTIEYGRSAETNQEA